VVFPADLFGGVWPTMNRNGHRQLKGRYQTAFGGDDSGMLSIFRNCFSLFKFCRRKQVAFLIVLVWVAGGAKNLKAEGNVLFHNATSFKIPFNVDAADKRKIKSLELYVSEDKGETWRLYTSITPTYDHFAFRGTRDGEYWFAVRTLDVYGRYNPKDDAPIEPVWRVVVDTQKPTFAMEVVARQGTTATVRWDARDENLDVASLKIEYSQPGTGVWRPVPIDRLLPSGETRWDAGSANVLRLRGSVGDKAGNIQNFETDLPDGVAQRPQMPAARAESMDSQAPAPIAHMASAGGDRRGILGTQSPRETPVPGGEEDWVDNPSAYGSQSASRGPEAGRMSQVYHGQNGANSSGRPMGPAGAESIATHVNLLNSPKFPLNYSVDDAGPNGPASVELWMTRDGGKNWSRWAEDADRTSPFPVDLGGEGFYGLSIIARSLAGQGDDLPRSGSQAQIWVEVDSTPPAIVLNTIKLGVGTRSGKVLISWRAEDRNFSSKPISLFYRPETSNQWVPIAENIENSGQYVWTPGPQVPPVFHVRIEAIDKAGNKSGVDTTNYDPVLFDRSRPRARILGLNTNASEISRSMPDSANIQRETRPNPVSANDYAKPVEVAPRVSIEKNLTPPPDDTSTEPARLPESPAVSEPARPKNQAIEPPSQPLRNTSEAKAPTQDLAIEPPALAQKPPIEEKPQENLPSSEPPKLPQSKPVEPQGGKEEQASQPPKLPQIETTELPDPIPPIDLNGQLEKQLEPTPENDKKSEEKQSDEQKTATPIEPE
jgi:hypothetical protein